MLVFSPQGSASPGRVELWRPACGRSQGQRLLLEIDRRSLEALGRAGSQQVNMSLTYNFYFVNHISIKWENKTWRDWVILSRKMNRADLQWLSHPPPPLGSSMVQVEELLWAPSSITANSPVPPRGQGFALRLGGRRLFYPFHDVVTKVPREKSDSLFSKFCVLHDLIGVYAWTILSNFPAFPNPFSISFSHLLSPRMTFSTPTVFLSVTCLY